MMFNPYSNQKRNESEELLDNQDMVNALAFMQANYPGYARYVSDAKVMYVIGRLLRENRMLTNIVKSYESSAKSPRLATDGSHPPFDGSVQFDPPCRVVDDLIKKPNKTIETDELVIDLNPASIRVRKKKYGSSGYEKPNAGIRK